MERTYRALLIIALAALAVVCLAVALAPEASAQEYDVRLTFKDEESVRMAQGLNPLSFNYSVIHTGTYLSEEVMIEIKNEPLYWQHFLSASTKAGVRTSTNVLEILLQRGERANVTLTITPPQNQLNKTFMMTFNVYPKKAAERNQSHDFGVIVPQFAAFEIRIFNEPPEGYYAAIPPSQFTLRFALFNTGNGNDKFLVGYESSRSDAGWKLTPTQGIDQFGWTTNLTADPEKRHPYFIDFTIKIPAEEKADITCQVIVNATSNFNQSKQMPPAFTTLKSLQYFDFQVYYNGPSEKDGSPGDQVEFQLRIYNKGNGPDQFTIIPVWDEELNPGFIASANPRTIVIASNETGLVSYIVKVPDAAPKKVYFFTAEVSSSSRDLAISTKSFEVEVGQFFKLSARATVSKMGTIPGGVLEFEVFVKNVGNGLDSIKLHLEGVPLNWINYTQPDEHSLLQNEEGKSNIRIIVPSEFDEAPIGSYNITVVANSARSTAFVRFDLQIDITQFYRVDWWYLEGPITYDEQPMAQSNIIKPRRTVNPYERNYIDIPLEIKNFGNGEDNIEVWGWAVNPLVSVVVAPTTTLLKRDETRLIKVRIEVPQTLPPGVYSLFVNTSSQDKNTKVKIVPLDFEVFNIDGRVPPIPTFIDPVQGDTVRSEISVDVHSNMSFKLRIENAGTKAMSGVLVRVYDVFMDKQGNLVRWNFFNFTTTPIAVGDKFTVGERPHTVQNPSISWWANVTGPHTLEFRIFYDYQSIASNDISSVNITVKAKAVEDSFVEQFGFIGLIVAIVVAVIIAVAYVFVLRRKPEVDKDLYSSIYGGEFEEPMALEGEAAPDADAGPQLTAEQQALYGDDYGTAGEGEEGAYDEGGYEDEEYPEEEQQ